MRRQFVPALVLLGGAGALLLGVVFLGRAARERLRLDGRYTTAFDDIDCSPPPGYERPAFLHEVQYLARLPDRLRVLDDDLPFRLADAFARHPWVENVVEVRAVPPDAVRVRLVFRTPTLAVRSGDVLRVVNGAAVLLPPSAGADGLPVLEVTSSPKGAAGRPWGDPVVTSAAAVAALLRPHGERLALTTYEAGEGGLILRGDGVRVVWGSAPGKEEPDEAPAARKVERLLEAWAESRPASLDLRPH